ncbi:MAG: L,D-transpeptidase family protein [Bacteroidota bacterium]|nr:L,D-transpeptidase family protein [Bacteroidota bacterium]MDP4218124.1 L,D-transpeptidase family protein [Bacteroidota bacterium]MDP4248198.1 L,D-transpeptidase family protein [Bacteroidota bacterium]MDP4257054.1 L,D-transpeptidase family protein [Bacteroidota bacterium]
MSYRKRFLFVLVWVWQLGLLFSCKDQPKSLEKDIVKRPAKMEEHVSGDLKKMLQFAADNHGKLNDSISLNYGKLLDSLYGHGDYAPIWSDKDHWLAPADSLYAFIEGSKSYGLFPSDYHFTSLAFTHRIMLEDSLARKNAALWARADLLLTDAFFTLVQNLKQGRLKYDSVTLRKDSVLSDTVYTRALASALQPNNLVNVLQSMEPRYKGYDSLKTYLKGWLSTAHFRPLTWLDWPYKDSTVFYHSLARRLQEVGYIDSTVTISQIDTVSLVHAIKGYQRTNGLTPNGKVSDAMVNMMDNTDWEKFKRIAITMDRYKLLPDTLPTTYVWVNLPSFSLKVIDSDTTVFESKVIVGAPKTRTPLLSSEISNYITLPQWTVPNSIIFKEMLPQIKKNIDYLRKQNLIVVDDNDSVRDPQKIKWARLSKTNFPFQLKQREGDDNSLGVIKFNFRNKYDVYMHDTNVRWMFGKSFRALSHGCVRLKEWQKMADFLIRNDTVKYHPDSVRAWIARKEKHTIYGFARVPIFLRYFTCEGKKGKLVFYEDIYGEDRTLRDRYFADKPIY